MANPKTPRTGPLCTCGGCRRYKTLKVSFRAQCARVKAPCWLCRQPIDYALDRKDKQSFSLDHRLPQSTRPELTEDPANFMPSHLSCNKSRGNRAPISLGLTSEQW